MKKIMHVTGVHRILIAGSIGLSMPAVGGPLEVQPRFESGVASYELVLEKFDSPNLIGGIPTISISRTSANDVMPFVGGGFALFADRAYLDFSAQHYFNGNGSSPVSTTNINRAGTIGNIAQADTITRTSGRQNDNIERTEWAFALGYNVNDRWSVYTGYKQAYTTIDSVIAGNVSTAFLAAPSQAIPGGSGSYNSDATRQFNYDGPFVGSSLSFQIEHGWLVGALTGNIAVAFMNGLQQLSLSNFILTTQSGAKVPVDPASPAAPTVGGIINGDSIGVTLGLTWKGTTSIENLSYSLGVVGYRYSFESDSQATQDFQETMIRSNLNVSYAFDI